MNVAPDLSLVIPAYDEEARLPVTLERLERHFSGSGMRVEVVIVDDGSSDATSAVAGEWAARHRNGRLVARTLSISHRGKGAAVRAGMTVTTGAIAGYCDADSSAAPEAIDDLYRRCRDGVDVALSSRAVPGAVIEVHQPWYRERAGQLFNLILRKLARIPYQDTQCGLKLFRAPAAAEIFRHQRLDGFAFDAEVVVLARELGFSLEEVPIRWRHSPGSKVSMLRDSFAMARDLVRIVRRLRAGDLHAPGPVSDPLLERRVETEAGHWWHRAKRNVVVRVLERLPAEGPVVDVGCGGGAMLRDVPVAPAFGTEPSAGAARHAARSSPGAVVRAEGSALPLRDESVGCVLALDVIEHHPRPEELLAEAARVLRPGGLLVVTVPAYDWMWSYADHVLGHYRRYTRRRLQGDVRGAGLEVVRCTYFHSWLLAPAWVFRTVRARVTSRPTPDDFPLPGPLNRALLALSRLEARAVVGRDVPFGLSVLAVGRRPPPRAS